MCLHFGLCYGLVWVCYYFFWPLIMSCLMLYILFFINYVDNHLYVSFYWPIILFRINCAAWFVLSILCSLNFFTNFSSIVDLLGNICACISQLQIVLSLPSVQIVSFWCSFQYIGFDFLVFPMLLAYNCRDFLSFFCCVVIQGIITPPIFPYI